MKKMIDDFTKKHSKTLKEVSYSKFLSTKQWDEAEQLMRETLNFITELGLEINYNGKKIKKSEPKEKIAINIQYKIDITGEDGNGRAHKKYISCCSFKLYDAKLEVLSCPDKFKPKYRLNWRRLAYYLSSLVHDKKIPESQSITSEITKEIKASIGVIIFPDVGDCLNSLLQSSFDININRNFKIYDLVIKNSSINNVAMAHFSNALVYKNMLLDNEKAEVCYHSLSECCKKMVTNDFFNLLGNIFNNISHNNFGEVSLEPWLSKSMQITLQQEIIKRIKEIHFALAKCSMDINKSILFKMFLIKLCTPSLINVALNKNPHPKIFLLVEIYAELEQDYNLESESNFSSQNIFKAQIHLILFALDYNKIEIAKKLINRNRSRVNRGLCGFFEFFFCFLNCVW